MTKSNDMEISNVFPCENYPKNGRMYFTGPEGNTDHRVTVEPEHRCIGIGTMSLISTSEADYLWRASPNAPFPKSKSQNVGAIGWGIPNYSDLAMPLTGQQIVIGQFRQECENRHTHRFQNAWYPGPNDQTAQVMNTNKTNQ